MTGSLDCFPFESLMLTKKKKRGERKCFNHGASHTCFCIAPEVETVCVVVVSDRAIGSNENKRLLHCEHRQWHYLKVLLLWKLCMYKCHALLSVTISASSLGCTFIHLCFVSPSSLVTMSSRGFICQLAVCMGTPILTPAWIHKAWERRDDV